MGLLDFEKCCFCIDLRVGCLIIGYLNLVGEVLSLIFVGMMAAATAAYMFLYDNTRKDIHMDRKLGIIIFMASVILFIMLCLFLAFTIVLLVGIHKNKRGHVKAYLIYSIVFQVISVLLFLASFAKPQSALDIIQNAIIIILSVYFLLVIRRYYILMGETPTIRAPNYNKA